MFVDGGQFVYRRKRIIARVRQRQKYKNLERHLSAEEQLEFKLAVNLLLEQELLKYHKDMLKTLPPGCLLVIFLDGDCRPSLKLGTFWQRRRQQSKDTEKRSPFWKFVYQEGWPAIRVVEPNGQVVIETVDGEVDRRMRERIVRGVERFKDGSEGEKLDPAHGAINTVDSDGHVEFDAELVRYVYSRSRTKAARRSGLSWGVTDLQELARVTGLTLRMSIMLACLVGNDLIKGLPELTPKKILGTPRLFAILSLDADKVPHALLTYSADPASSLWSRVKKRSKKLEEEEPEARTEWDILVTRVTMQLPQQIDEVFKTVTSDDYDSFSILNPPNFHSSTRTAGTNSDQRTISGGLVFSGQVAHYKKADRISV